MITEWINSEIELPKSNGEYLVFVESGKKPRISIMTFHRHFDDNNNEITAWLFALTENTCYKKVPFWMPLPQNPN